jgi:hypothetical protein
MFSATLRAMQEPTSRLYRWLRRHTLVCFLAMTISFVVFGCLTVDLVRLVTANAGLIFAYGLNGLQEGGFQQLLELWLGAVLAMGLYLTFKLCEQVLLHALTGTNPS